VQGYDGEKKIEMHDEQKFKVFKYWCGKFTRGKKEFFCVNKIHDFPLGY
jgi:hypothetical protein